jgi:hypothetical protein
MRTRKARLLWAALMVALLTAVTATYVFAYFMAEDILAMME